MLRAWQKSYDSVHLRLLPKEGKLWGGTELWRCRETAAETHRTYSTVIAIAVAEVMLDSLLLRWLLLPLAKIESDSNTNTPNTKYLQETSPK